MNVIRTLWASIQGSPVFMRRINGWLTIFWIVMIPVSVATGWIHSVSYISALSLWALVSGHWSAWQAARVEVEQDRQAREMLEHPPEERILETLVSETTIEKLPDVEVQEHGKTKKVPAAKARTETAVVKRQVTADGTRERAARSSSRSTVRSTATGPASGRRTRRRGSGASGGATRTGT